MSQMQASVVVQEVTSQGASATQTSSVAGEVINRTTVESPMQTSSVLGEVLNRSSVESAAVTSSTVVEVIYSVSRYPERLHPIHQRRNV